MDVITYLFHPQEKGHYFRRREGAIEREGETARQQTGWKGGSKMEHGASTHNKMSVGG